MAVEYRIATVLSDDGGILQMMDRATGNGFSIYTSAPGGVGPMPGDVWLLDIELGAWNLKQCIRRASEDANPARNLADVMARLEARQLVSTSFPQSDSPEGLHLAKIGEVRWISYAPDPFWWPEANGAAVQRLKYRELGTVIAPGTTPTFDLPLAPILGTVVPYVCAR